MAETKWNRVPGPDDAYGSMTGARYIDSLKDNREVWIDGRLVEDVTADPAFKLIIDEMARLYDLQDTDEYRDDLTFVDKDSGVRTSASWILPKSAEELKAKRRNSEVWHQLTWGQLGRSPDILAPYIIACLQRKETFAQATHPKCDFGENLENYYQYCMKNDLFLTHALGDPQVDRSTTPQNQQRETKEEMVALHVVEEAEEGVIVTGGKQLSTAATHTNECYVSLSATFARRNDPNCVLAFSVPCNTPGLKILAREPTSRWFGTWGHPLQMYDEQDCMLFFDRALIPWNRLFALYDSAPMARMFSIETGASPNFNFLGWANMCRASARMRLMTAVTTLVAESIGVIEYREVANKLGEMAVYCEVFSHAMEGVEHKSGPMPNGEWALGPGRGLHIWFAMVSSRMVEIMREICASGVVMQPSEKDLANPDVRKYLDLYMRGKDVDVEHKSRLFRLAHDLCASSFAVRQDIYEYWHGGDPTRNRINLLNGFDQKVWKDQVRELISKPLAHGDVL